MNAILTTCKSMDLLDIILSCSICQIPLSSLKNSSDKNKPKLWMTECGHLTCATHLLGGGVPFHSEAMQPRAPCPLCSIKKGDSTQKALFSVEGSSSMGYNPVIPGEYFKIPPTKLDGDGIESEALRFQYLSLVRFSLATREKMCLLERELEQIENHKSLLLRYINAVTFMQQELKASRQRLLDLGQDVTSIDAAVNFLEDNAVNNASNGSKLQSSAPLCSNIDTTYLRSSIAQAGAADLDELICRHGPLGNLEYSYGTPGMKSFQDSARKRRRRASGLHETAQSMSSDREIQPFQLQIRDMMSPLTLLDQSPRVLPAHLNMRNDQAVGNPPVDFRSQLFPPKDRGFLSNIQSNSEYRSIQDGAARQYAAPERTLTTPHRAPYNYIPNDRVLHDSHSPKATPNSEPQFSHTQAQSDNPFAMTQQNLSEPQVSGIFTIQESHPHLVDTERSTFSSSTHHNQGGIQSPMRERVMLSNPDMAVQDLPNSYQGDQYKNRFRRNTMLNFPTNLPTTNLRDPAKGGDSTSYAGLFDNSITNNPASLRISYRLPSSNYGASNRKPVGSIVSRDEPSDDFQHLSYRRDDGELDNQNLQIPAPRLAPGVGISPTRPRITLAPRGSSISCTPRPRTGMSANIRSSSAVTPIRPGTSRPHREPLGTLGSHRLPAMSPYFSHQRIPPKGSQNHITYPKSRDQMQGFLQGPITPAQTLFSRTKLNPANGVGSQSSVNRERFHSREESRKPPSSARLRRRAQR